VVGLSANLGHLRWPLFFGAVSSAAQRLSAATRLGSRPFIKLHLPAVLPDHFPKRPRFKSASAQALPIAIETEKLAAPSSVTDHVSLPQRRGTVNWTLQAASQFEAASFVSAVRVRKSAPVSTNRDTQITAQKKGPSGVRSQKVTDFYG